MAILDVNGPTDTQTKKVEHISTIIPRVLSRAQDHEVYDFMLNYNNEGATK